jgi:hypothetical protein
MQIIDGRVEDVVKPSPRYSEIAVACRAMGMDIADGNYERIDTLVESNSMWTTTANDADSSIDFLVAGYLPRATYKQSLAN